MVDRAIFRRLHPNYAFPLIKQEAVAPNAEFDDGANWGRNDPSKSIPFPVMAEPGRNRPVLQIEVYRRCKCEVGQFKRSSLS